MKGETDAHNSRLTEPECAEWVAVSAQQCGGGGKYKQAVSAPLALQKAAEIIQLYRDPLAARFTNVRYDLPQ